MVLSTDFACLPVNAVSVCSLKTLLVYYQIFHLVLFAKNVIIFSLSLMEIGPIKPSYLDTPVWRIYPMEGYGFPKCGDKPQFSTQLGTYVDKLCTLYPSQTLNGNRTDNKWNWSPLHKNKQVLQTMTFDTNENPALAPTSNPKRNQQSVNNPQQMPPTWQIPWLANLQQNRFENKSWQIWKWI